MERRVLWWCGTAMLVPLVLLDSPCVDAQNPCVGKMNCSACITTPTCSWCSQPNMTDSKRCFQTEWNWGCPGQFVHSSTFQYKVIRNNEISQSENVQIAPQYVTVKLPINQPHRVKFTYAQAEDYPVDLYYLMDLSNSMADDKDKLSTLGDILVESMLNVTSDFQLGFGSFVEKIVMPYVVTVPSKLEHPCKECAAPYGFKNHMSLGTDATDFSHLVKNAAVSGNLDGPEGGFDAIMQAIVCRQQIGWRDRARRLLVFSTDAEFHYAGDGKLGGIVKPNDGKCHLDKKGLYTHSTLQDYPSVSQINMKVKEHAINIIFAVTQEQIVVYERLKSLVEGSSVGQLSNDSSNIIDLIRDQYEKITSSIEMQDNATNSLIQLRYFTKCVDGRSDSVMYESNVCGDLKVGSKVNFEIELFAKQCPNNPADRKQIIQIYPVGINESLIVELEILCECECDKEGHKTYEKKSSSCNYSGNLVCGVCQCDDHHFGPQCECDSQGEGKEQESVYLCRKDNTSHIECSGRGSCVCGQCICYLRTNTEESVWGRYCECDDFSCNYGNGKICSGPSHGKCDCGVCRCELGWSGNACECSTENEPCFEPKSAEMCSGRGTCKCGKCKCDFLAGDGGEQYSGKYCERVPLTASHCVEYQACVQCLMYQKGVISQKECAANCTNFVISSVENVEAKEEEGEEMCILFDEDGCRYKFVYHSTGTVVVIQAQETLVCPLVANVYGVVTGVICAIFLIGSVLIILWKIVTTVHDRREYVKFVEQTKLVKWDAGENPIYREAISTFKNPLYKNH